MHLTVTKHLFSGCFISLLLLMGASKKDRYSLVTPPANLIYKPDTSIVLKGVSDTSVTPSIDWNGRKGTFSLPIPITTGSVK